MLFPYLKGLDLWIMNYNIRIAIKCSDFGLRIAKSSCHRKSSGQYSQRTSQIELLILVHLVLVISDNLVGSGPIVYFSTSISDSLSFTIFTRLMIETQWIDTATFFTR